MKNLSKESLKLLRKHKWIILKGPVIHSSPHEGKSDTAPSILRDPDQLLSIPSNSQPMSWNKRKGGNKALPHASPPLFTAPKFGISLNVDQSSSLYSYRSSKGTIQISQFFSFVSRLVEKFNYKNLFYNACVFSGLYKNRKI